ncbi:MAG TPA: amidohydrolase [Terriglobales bacterium]|nr:amidohydrolase [Terriglobales bacterium]
MRLRKLVLCSVLLYTFAAWSQNAPDLEALKKEATADIDSRQVFTQQMVDQIFSYAELGFQEFQTSRYVSGILENNGFHVERAVAGIPTAWVASYGSGKPVIAFITDIDCIPRASQKPGVAYHDPIIEGAPGHGEGHNSGQAVNVTAAIVLRQLMQKNKIAGTLKVFPGVAEELLGTKAFYIRAGLFKDVDLVLGSHVDDSLGTEYGSSFSPQGLVSVQYFFHGTASHAAAAPWDGRSALDAVELMDTGWNFRREHLRLAQRSHYVIVNGGDQPNVVPSEAAVWYYFRELDYPHIKDLFELGNTMANAAAAMTGTTVNSKVVGSAWPGNFSKFVAEIQQKNIERVGMPQWSDADQTLARALQKEIGAKVDGLNTKVDPLKAPDPANEPGGSDDVGDISWVVPTVYLRYPANIPHTPGHSWVDAVAMATPIAHKGSTAGAKVQALTALDFLTSPQLVKQAQEYFNSVQTKDMKYTPLIAPNDQPAIEFNKDKMAKFLPEMQKYYYDPSKYKTYLEQLGIQYPTVRK